MAPANGTSPFVVVVICNQLRRRTELFNDRIGRIPATITDPAGPFRTFFDAESPEIEWKNFLLKYVEPQVSPVQVGSWRSFSVSVASLALSLGALLGVA
ncbi:MAG: hypothetical protein ACR2PF_16015, partial [Rhizobiaceae bacterium]